MSDAVHCLAPRRLVRSLSTATAALGLAGGALALAMSGGAHAGATTGQHPTAGGAPVTVKQGAPKGGDWPYFACVAVLKEGICVGPPTS